MNIGDTVRLKSGGPIMTVREVEESEVTCNWFSEDKNIVNSYVFSKDQLEKGS